MCDCPICKQKYMADISIDCLEDRIFGNESEARKYILDNITIKTVLKYEEDVKKNNTMHV
jgi:hypothetical protein